jgi:hypothetical protein
VATDEFLKDGRCTACPAWDGNALTIDLDTRVLIIGVDDSYNPEGLHLYALGSGCDVPLGDQRLLRSFLAKSFVPHLRFTPGWHAEPATRFTHTILSGVVIPA